MNTAVGTLELDVPSSGFVSASTTRPARMIACGLLGLMIFASTIGIASQERRGVRAIGATKVDLGVLLAFEPVSHVVEIKNHSWLSTFDGVSASSSCGCTSANVASSSIRPRETTFITVVAIPKPFDREIYAAVHVRTENTPLLSLQVFGEVLAPFAGWPDRIMWEREGQDLVCRVNPAYADWVKAGVAIVGGGERVLKVVKPVDGSLFLRLEATDAVSSDLPVEIGLCFGNEAEGMNWWGWAVSGEQLSQAP